MAGTVDPRCPIDAVPAVLERARAAGAWTPQTRALVFHDLGRMRGRIADLHSAFPSGALHAVAIKANPIVQVLRDVVATGAGLEAASWEEVQLALAAGCPADRLVFDAPAKTREELAGALALGLWLNVDRADELALLKELGAPGNARIGIRVNPQVGDGAIAATSTVGKGSKFGVPIADVPALVRQYPFVSGLMVHTGSQGVGLPLLKAAAWAVAEQVEALGLQWLDVGGGVPVRYTQRNAEPPSFAAWGAELRGMPGWDSRPVLTEVGRAIQAGCGWALTRIAGAKLVDGQPTFFVHLGADFLLRRVYRPDDWDHDLILLDAQGRPRTGPVRPTTIAGPLCFSGDLLARGREMPEARPDDLLLIRDVGAYSLSMWSRHCSRGLPATWGYDQADIKQLHAGETPQDIVSFWS